MTAHYIYNAPMTIIFDGEFEVHVTDTLENAVSKALNYIDIYGFDEVEIIHGETGEILVTIGEDED
jgi:hypothetical protein